MSFQETFKKLIIVQRNYANGKSFAVPVDNGFYTQTPEQVTIPNMGFNFTIGDYVYQNCETGKFIPESMMGKMGEFATVLSADIITVPGHSFKSPAHSVKKIIAFGSVIGDIYIDLRISVNGKPDHHFYTSKNDEILVKPIKSAEDQFEIVKNITVDKKRSESFRAR